MSQFIKSYFTPSKLNMFRTLIHPSSGVCDFSIIPPHWLCSEKTEVFNISVNYNIQGVPGGMCQTSGECSLC